MNGPPNRATGVARPGPCPCWVRGGMDDCDSPRLSQYEPVIEGLASIAWTPDGWHLSLRHRHYSGRLSECSPDVYEHLTMAEMQDVLMVTLEGWGFASDPRGTWGTTRTD
jgi:hypothetical protein